MKMNWVRDYCARHWRGLALGAGALSLFAGSGCTVTTTNNTPEPLPAGQLIVDWTIEGGKDPALCAVGNATDIDIIVNTTSGVLVHEYLANCGDFATTISNLFQGSYAANATLVDGSGVDRTTVANIGSFTMTSADLLATPIDFPANSFR